MITCLVVSPRDNVGTALEAVAAGQVIVLPERTVTAREAIPAGHKMALVAIPGGAAVVKYGSPIGVTSQPIEAGAHVHTHNVISTRGNAASASPRVASERTTS